LNSRTLFDNFGPDGVNLNILKQKAFNLRWAAVPADVIPLTAADPDFPAAMPIREAICQYSIDGYFSYGDSKGYTPLKEALASHYANNKNVLFNPEFILPVDSAAYGIYLICKTFLKPGDEAIIFDPVDFLFKYSIELTGAKAITFPIPPNTADAEFEKMEMLLTPKTKMICVCNPVNPTGKVFSRKELQILGNIAVKHNLLILSDEIWSDIIFKPAIFTSISALDDNIRKQTITVTGFSKSFGLAGLRVGAVLTTNQSHFDSIYEHSFHQSTIKGTNILGQVAATAALNDCNDWLKDFVNHLQKMRDLTVEALNMIPGFSCSVPDGCYLAFVDIRNTGLSSTGIQEKLLQKGKVAVVPGLKEWFGGGAEGYIRLSFATSEVILREALERIKKTMA
jgi:aminotransferase